LAFSPVIQEKIKSTIDVPYIAVVAVGTGSVVYADFNLDTDCFYRNFDAPSNEILMENLRSGEMTVINVGTKLKLPDSPQNYVLAELMDQNTLLDFAESTNLLIKISGQMLSFIQKGKTERSLSNRLSCTPIIRTVIRKSLSVQD
jgi:hypothetical protein